MNYQEASDFIKRQANLYKGFVDVAATLESISSIDNAAKEAEKARAVAEKARDSMLVELSKVSAKVNKEQEDAAKALKEANEQRDAILADANIKAQNLVMEAVSFAKDDIDKTIEAAKAEATRISGQASYNTEVVKGLKADIEALEAEMDEKQNTLKTLNDSIELLKAKFGA